MNSGPSDVLPLVTGNVRESLRAAHQALQASQSSSAAVHQRHREPLTARATSRERLEGLERGADDYLIKPFDVEELKARVGNLIAVRRKLRERFAREGRFLLENAPVTSLDEAFLRKIIEAVQQHLRDDQFDVDSLARIVGFSVLQLERKLEGIPGQRPNEFIRAIRLEQARHMLEARAGTVSEIAFDVGFNNLSYFARSYKKKFGFSPSRTPEATRN